MKNILLLLVVVIGTFYLQSCVCHGCGAEQFGMVMSTYPAAVNDQWVYQVTDSVAHTVDTATFTITAAAVYNSDSTVYSTQTKVGNIVTDSGTLLQTPGSFTYRPSGTQSLFEYLKLVYPIAINGGWQGYYTGDSLHVVAANITQPVLNMYYQDVFELKRYYLTPGYALEAYIYLAPNIGIVEENILISNGASGTSNKTLLLISYVVH
jgi:hypothetical protein